MTSPLDLVDKSLYTVSQDGIPQIHNFIDGKFSNSETSEWIDLTNPATGKVIARVPQSTQSEIDQAIASAKSAFQEWRYTAISTRARIFLKYQSLIRDHMEDLAKVLTWEQGKTLPDAQGDVFRGLEVVEHAANIGTLQMGEFANNVATGIDTYTINQPLGVCAGITPFNFPAMIPLWMFPMAIACGNGFVLKPSEQDPIVAMMLVKLAQEAGIPDGLLNVIHGGADSVNAICDHTDIRAVSFVGSTAVGTHVYNRASQNGKRAQCMMGAKNHSIVLPDAHREKTVNALLGSAYGAAGQRCMALPVTVLVGEAKEIIADIVEGAKKLNVNAGHVEGADLGPLISQKALSRALDLIEEGVKDGATLELDGRDVMVKGYEDGYFLGPTVFSGVKTDMSIYTQEIFGPVLCIICVDDIDDAIALINENPNGNGTAIFTSSGAKARQFQEEIDVGQVGINVPIPVPVPLFSFSGSRASKLGDLGPYGKQVINFYTQTKTVTSRWFEEGDEVGAINTTISMK